jgi:tetratricopeptide (TPR) repeat protein
MYSSRILLTGFPARAIFLMLALQLFTACSQKNPLPATQTTPDTETTASQSTQAPQQKPVDTELYQKGLDALAANDFDNARKIFQQFISDNPQLSGAYINLAIIDVKQDKPEQAAKLLEIALSLNPQQATAYHLRGQVELKQGKIKQARDDFKKAIELKPDYTIAHYNLALVYDIYLQEIALAVEQYNLYLSLTTEKDTATREWVNHLKNTLNNG